MQGFGTRILAATLTATIAFLFVAPPQVWAHWGVDASLAVTRSFDLAADGSLKLAASLAADSRLAEPLSQVRAAVRLAATSLSAVTGVQHAASEQLAARFGLDTEPRPARLSFTNHPPGSPAGRLPPRPTGRAGQTGHRPHPTRPRAAVVRAR